ncbi:STAS domain-containing protein [Micromonospora endophytica]|uniref:Anti-anti-sigma factor n=1 Tax=Micromonospora endophytica TaxID=515350 RepID=A0A2W2BLJ1_9ACTN|nr:STAS domain-containing protein [Micromonospora endophytica]PZF86882.1 anti-anti-sigma factor [Micromonospora endophytica]RIW48288.1 anti-sigma factor antagonist [Micromonospora endophytica]BCJ56645.1 anti-sigma factor antagonist [Micromonospora endophytica]
MSSPLLTIEVGRFDGDRAELRLSGDLDFDSAPDLISAVAELRRDGYQQLVIDLTGVGLCDSSGLSAFVVARRGGSVPIRLTGVSATLRQLLDRTGLTELLDLPASEDEGAQAAG